MIPKYTNLPDIQTELAANKLQLVDLVDHYLHRIDTQPSLNIYIEVFAEEARARAQALDQKRQSGAPLGRLHGMIISIKDVICYADHGVSGGSKILEGFQSLFSATAVERILAEDVIIIGRTNCDEFAMGSTNETSYYGPTLNAADPTRTPGGSSGGAAVSVQADTCLAALGSDTGGSVRQPAGFCGLIGLKPTYGRISRHGLLAYGSSFDQIGTISHSVSDAALLLEIMAGPDDFDATALQTPVDKYTDLKTQAGPYRIAYLAAALDHPSMDSAIAQSNQNLLDRLRTDGHTIESIDFPLLDYLVPTYYVLTTAEASTNLSRYDGLRYGFRHPDANDLEETYRMSRSAGFGAEVKRRIMLGTFVLSAGYYDAYFGQAQKVRRLLRDQLNIIFEQYDFICLPLAPHAPNKLGESLDDPVRMYLADIFTVIANLTGVPAIALPLDTHPATGMPTGIQFMAGKQEERKLLQLGQMLEANKLMPNNP